MQFFYIFFSMFVFGCVITQRLIYSFSDNYNYVCNITKSYRKLDIFCSLLV